MPRPPPAAPSVPASTLLALGLAGFCAFLNVYATQPLLPLFREVFGISSGEAALTVSAPTVAVALASPFFGAIADRFGRRRVIVGSLFALSVPTLLAATSSGIGALVAWRFAQGLAVPGIYAVGIAYISEACGGAALARGMAALVTGNVVGGFCGRAVSGFVGEHAGWRAVFVALGLLTAIGALATSRFLPRQPPPSGAPRALRPLEAIRRLGPRLATPRLLATYAVGFNVLFVQVAMFTYATFHLAAPPFRLGAAALSSIFLVYLVGAVITPFAGRWIDRVGSRRALAVVLATAVAGGGLTLLPALWAVALGLALCCTAVFVSQSASTAFLQSAAEPEARSTAAGIYVSSYYLGGAAGGILPAAAWHLGGWTACVALVALVQLGTIALAFRYWGAPKEAPSPAPAAV
ncbi:MFS transporter [Anaeromyxobacter paludicola]|uniref:MFS transporter n=1 Tax=Anaeromyxobacter paludicola TaxID=2918171 RepID=A0ABM7X695_9BACT|nr:MFS transporter [Anaeromyxobacter paludicola]BDG07342.1 MFS transporter [Anaeromyxobacter paludicola]